MENFDKFWHLLPKKDADVYFVSVQSPNDNYLKQKLITIAFYIFLGAAK